MVQLFDSAEQIQRQLQDLIKQRSFAFPDIALDDVDEMNVLLSNVSEALVKSPNEALSVLSSKLQWLFTHNIPGLTERVLSHYPEVRRDRSKMIAYTFIIDFMETFANESKKLHDRNENLLKEIILLAKQSDLQLSAFLSENSQNVTSGEFLLFLDLEIENCEPASPKLTLLQTIKLLILEEAGKKMGVDVATIPKLASEPDPTELRRLTRQYISNYDINRKKLFHQNVKIMLKEMRSKYKADNMLVENLIAIGEVVETEILNSLAILK